MKSIKILIVLGFLWGASSRAVLPIEGGTCVLLLMQEAVNEYAEQPVDLSGLLTFLVSPETGAIDWTRANDLTFDIDKTDGLGRTLLHLAVYEKKIDLAQVLVRRGASLEAADRLGRRPLHFAAYDTSGEMERWLLSKKGIDVHAADITGQTFLHLVAREGSVELIKPLIELQVNLKRANLHGQTTLHLAAAANQADTVNLLLKADPSLAHVTSEMHETALHEAAANGCVDAAQALCHHSSHLTKWRDTNGNTALQLAVLSEQSEMVKFLIAANSPLNNKNNRGQTALHMVVASDKLLSDQAVQMVELLLINSASMDVKDANGDTPVHWAVRRSDERVLRSFLSRTPGFSVRNDKTGNTILHTAARHGSVGAVRLLLDWGHAPKLQALNKERQSPLHIAASEGHAGVVSLLLEWHADTRARDKKKKTPIDLARQYDHTEATDVLAAFEYRSQ